MKSITLFFILSITAFNSFAQWEQLNGPKNNFAANAIASVDSLLLVSTSCGIYYSSNYGAKWNLSNGILFSQSVLFHDTLYTGGSALEQVYINSGIPVIKAIHNPFNVGSFYSDNNSIYAARGDSGFYFSSDGRNWFNNNSGIPLDSSWYPTYSGGFWEYQHTLYSISGNAQYLFGGTQHGIYRYSLLNKAWMNMNSGVPAKPVTSVYCKDSVVIICSHYLPPYIYEDSIKIYKSADNGNSWKLKYTLPSCIVNEIKNINDTLYISTSGNYPYTSGQGLLASYDFGETWTKVNTGSLVDFYGIESISNEYFVASDSGIYKNLNRLININNNIVCSTVTGFAQNDSTIAAVFYDESGDDKIISITKDNGMTWTNTTQALPINYVEDVVNLNNTFFFSGDHSGASNCINYTSTDDGYTWDSVSAILNDGIAPLVATNGSMIVASYFKSFSIILSSDGGLNWKNVTPPNSLNLCNEVTSLLFHGNNIYVTTCNINQVAMSPDLGVSWVLINNGLPANEQIISGYCKGILFITSGDTLFGSEDNGTTWKKWSNTYTTFNDLTSDSLNIYATDGTDVYFSVDSGRIWNDITENLPVGGAPLLVKDNYLYFGTSDHGIWRRPTQNLPLSVAQTKPPQPLTLFPNPTTGELYINTPTNAPIQQVDIINLNGEIIFSTTMTSDHINISQLSSGFYIVRSITPFNIYYSKIVKQ